jgi:hypothetical protein
VENSSLLRKNGEKPRASYPPYLGKRSKAAEYMEKRGFSWKKARFSPEDIHIFILTGRDLPPRIYGGRKITPPCIYGEINRHKKFSTFLTAPTKITNPLSMYT